MNPIKKTFTLGDQQVTLETGEIARQAHGAVVCTIDDTVVLATVVGAKEPKAGQDWFPLTVDYAENAPTPRARFRAASSSARAARPRRRS